MTTSISNTLRPVSSYRLPDLTSFCQNNALERTWKIFKDNVLDNKYFHTFMLYGLHGLFFTTGAILSLAIYSPLIRKIFDFIMRRP